MGNKYWKKYLPHLKEQNDIILSILEDLCYWEQIKEEAQKDIEEYGATQKTPNGYTQSSGYFQTYKSAQEKVSALKTQLFGQTEKEAKRIENKSGLKVKSFEEFKLKKAK